MAEHETGGSPSGDVDAKRRAGELRGESRIGPYHLDGALGAGGMGAVYRARHEQTNSPVALKIAVRSDPIVVDSVRREIGLLGRIRHPGVVSLIDSGTHELRPWYAMELIEGEAIADLINRMWGKPPRKKTPIPDTEERAIRDIEAQAMRADDAETRPMRGATVPMNGPVDASSGELSSDSDEAPPSELRPQAASGHLADVVQLFARLCQTLGYLHGEGIVHLDLKPTNILLRADGQPCIVDFGITRQIAGGLNREVLNVDPLQGGTEHYMAPEQIVGGRTDARTDLYGLGCMLYEALTGRPPFLRTPSMSVGEQHMKRAPKPPSAWAQGIPPELDAGVLQLLAKQPEKRMGYAGDMLDLLCRMGARIDPELAVRKPKPYLYRPNLVGRDDVMEHLRNELERAERGQGRCVFLLGPSGGGKTRVAMELGREAFASDMRVVSGECAPVTLSAIGAYANGTHSHAHAHTQANPHANANGHASANANANANANAIAHSNAHAPAHAHAHAHAHIPHEGRPLQPFQAMLSTVVDLCNAGGAATTAALVGDALPVLENLEPAFARVPGRDQYGPRLSMNAAGAHGRVEQALANTIIAVARAKPLLLVIDDLQWADALSLAVIRALVTASRGSTVPTPVTDADTKGGAGDVKEKERDDRVRVCVLATCRSDELTPELEELVRSSAAAHYDLKPLAQPDVASIIAGMIARDDAPAALVELIGARSGGNPFFVAEYLQAAVNAGQLRRDAEGRWALAVDEGGLHLPETPTQLLSARVDALDPVGRALLEMAAVLGRAFPRSLLRRPHTHGQQARAPSFEEIEELIGRGILVEDGPTRLRFTHDKLREATYAGISDERRRELHQLASEALAEAPLPAPSAAAELEREAMLAHHTRAAGMRAEHFKHASRAGLLANRVGAHQQAASLLREALDASTETPDVAVALSKLELARLWSTYGTVLENLGHVDEGVPALEKALALLDHRVPPAGAPLAAFIASQLGRHLVRRVVGAPKPKDGGTAAREHVVEAAETAAALARGYVGVNKQANIIGSVLLSANLAEEGRVDGPIVHAYSFLGGIAGLLGMKGAAAGYFDRARAAAARDGRLETALTLSQIEGFYFMSNAEWAKASAVTLPLVEKTLAASAFHLAEPPLITLNYIHMLQGDLDKAGEYCRSLLEMTKKTGNERFYLVGSLALSLHEMYRGQYEQALARIEALHERVMKFDEVIHRANFHATRAGLLSLLDRHVEAVDWANKAVDSLADTGSRNALLYNVHAFTPETYLRAWAHAKANGQDADAAMFADRAAKAITACGQFSGVCGYAKPMHARFKGEAALLAGNVSGAAKMLERAVLVATKQSNAYEGAMAARALASASMTTLSAEERAKWRERARERFTKLGHARFLAELSSS